MQNFKTYLKSAVGIFLIGAIIADFFPQPMDFVYFLIQNFLHTHPVYSLLGLPPNVSYEIIQIFSWYFLDTIYWVILFFLGYFLHIKKVKTINIITTIAIIVSIGAVIGIILQFVI